MMWKVLLRLTYFQIQRIRWPEKYVIDSILFTIGDAIMSDETGTKIIEKKEDTPRKEELDVADNWQKKLMIKRMHRK